MKIFVGADHRGFVLKQQLVAYLKKRGFDVFDEGGNKLDPNDDFIDFATLVTTSVLANDDSRGILLCGSGQGMVIAANRRKGIRAGLGWSQEAAHSIRNDEDSNVLALPAELLERNSEWQGIVDTWLQTPFAGAERYKRRNRRLDDIF